MADDSVGHIIEDKVTDLTFLMGTAHCSFILLSLHQASLKRGLRVVPNQ